MPRSDQTALTKESQPDDDASVGWLRAWIKRAIRFVLVAVFLLCIAIWVIYASAQREPDFYKVALELEKQTLAEQGIAFERQVLDLQNNARTMRQWQAVFTDDQINGWLASDFPEKFPGALPHSVSDPRVGIDKNALRVAFRFNSGRIKGIVQAEVDAFCTDVPGQIAIRIKKVSSGWVPIPVNSIADRISAALRRLGAQVEWSEIDSDPVALIEIPADKVRIGDKRVTIESIQLLENKLVLIGKSVEVD